MKRAGMLTVVMALLTAAAAGETGIKTVVRMLETRHSVRHHGIPGLWLAKPMLIGSGLSGLQIAEFQAFPLRGSQFETVRDEVARALGPEWSPFVETWERDGEWSVIYARGSDAGFTMLIVNLEPSEALTLLQVKVTGKSAERWLNDPAEAAMRSKIER
jgi:hypothetical protein